MIVIPQLVLQSKQLLHFATVILSIKVYTAMCAQERSNMSTETSNKQTHTIKTYNEECGINIIIIHCTVSDYM